MISDFDSAKDDEAGHDLPSQALGSPFSDAHESSLVTEWLSQVGATCESPDLETHSLLSPDRTAKRAYEDDEAPSGPKTMVPRAYQKEMIDKSLQKNVIVAVPYILTCLLLLNFS